MPEEVMKGNKATALAAKLAEVDVVPAYPITPSTLFPEQISEYIANGEMDAELILVESEHSAMSACIGASATGARVSTATSSQGLELMHEMLFVAAGMRLPIVAAVGNRALSAPINIWCDHQDTISARDAGWIQFYAEDNQESFDLMLLAFKVAEDRRVLLPAMIGLDAFVLTHTIERVKFPTIEEVREFIPKYNPIYRLDVKNPITIGSFAPPANYMEFKWAQTKALDESWKVIDEVFDQFNAKFGRKYTRISTYKTEDADTIVVAMGSMAGTLRETIDELRAEGKKVGMLKITVFRPFPGKEIMKAIKGAKTVCVADRSVSPGLGGPVYSEIASQMVTISERPEIYSFVVGLGGRDIVQKDFKEIVKIGEEKTAKGEKDTSLHWININPEMEGGE